MQNLALHEDPEALAAGMAEKVGRPVFVCSPDEVDEVDGFLSMYYDLELCTSLMFATPLKKGEYIDDVCADNIRFLTRGATVNFERTETDPVVVANGLAPFIHKFRKWSHQSGWGMATGLRFAVSLGFQAPNRRQESWAVCRETPNTVYKGEVLPETDFSVIRPPGQYSGPDEHVLEPHTSYGTCERSPGPCIVCHGRAGQRKHFGTLVATPGRSYLSGLICLACLPGLHTFVSEDEG